MNLIIIQANNSSENVPEFSKVKESLSHHIKGDLRIFVDRRIQEFFCSDVGPKDFPKGFKKSNVALKLLTQNPQSKLCKPCYFKKC